MVNTKNQESVNLQLAHMNQNNHLATNPDFNKLEKLLLQQLDQALKCYENLPESELIRPSTSNGWSIAQCLDHLNSYFLHYLPRIETQLDSAPDCPQTLLNQGWLGRYLINMIDPDRKPAKYKALKKHLPGPTLQVHRVVAEFIEHLEQFRQLLAIAASKDINGIRIPTSIHPLVKLRLGATFLFLLKHNERHIRQANRNIQPASPPSSLRLLTDKT